MLKLIFLVDDFHAGDFVSKRVSHFFEEFIEYNSTYEKIVIDHHLKWSIIIKIVGKNILWGYTIIKTENIC